MITGEIKNKVDQIWTTLWTEGLTNPLTAIEQLTYLLFTQLSQSNILLQLLI